MKLLGFGGEFPTHVRGDHVPPVAIIRFGPVGAAEFDEVPQRRTQKTLPAGIATEGGVADLGRFGEAAANGVAIGHSGEHFQVYFSQSLTFLGAPVSVKVFLQIVTAIKSLSVFEEN